MNPLLLFLTSVLISFEAFSQSVYLEYSHKSPSGTGFFTAHITDSISSFSYKPEKQVYNHQHYGNEFNDNNVFFIKSKKDNFLYYKGGLLGEGYYIKDSLQPMKWKLDNEHKMILGFKCKSAKTVFRGRNYIAYYTEKIPISDGPFKFGGLPGLILYIASDDKEYMWQVEKIIQNYKGNKQKVSIENLMNNYKFVGWQTHVSRYKSEVNKMVANLRAKKGANDYTANFKIDDAEIIYPEAQLGNGIEY